MHHNDFNQNVHSDATVRVGNWVEENALKSITGMTRQQNGMNNTALRTMDQRGDNSISSIHQQDYQYFSHNDVKRKQEALPRKADLKAAKYQELAEKIYNQEQARQVEEERQGNSHALYEGRQPFNLKRAVDFSQPEGRKSSTLNDTPITLYTWGKEHVVGTTPATGVNPVARNDQFTRPAQEFYGQNQR